ncbi:FlgK family flagellar hook-associated protein [Gephyromycinifex aptenodytis]|uniref:FlgK family flagellar hook-associated protein n=1 Tax=Gephyromycinifex aptenodytis TaxID=2716227 RepID=UPI001447825E|nr:hypothetical protein [Gephyromycinifex aptenodytis]
MDSAEAARAGAARAEMDARRTTYEGVERVVRESARTLQPQLARLEHSQRAPARRAAERRETVDRADEVARQFRVTAARIHAMRLALSDQAARTVHSANQQAAELAELNQQVRADPGSGEALADRQLRLASALGESTGAVSTREGDGTLTVRVGSRALVQGESATAIALESGSNHREPALAPRQDPAGEFEPRQNPSPGPVDDAAGALIPRTPAEAAPARPAETQLPTVAPQPPTRDTPGPAPGASQGTAQTTGAEPGVPTSRYPAVRAIWPDGDEVALGGAVRGYLVAAQATVGTVLHRLDALAQSVLAQTNAVQAAGLTVSGQPGPPLLQGTSAWELQLAPGTTPDEVVVQGRGAPSGQPLPRAALPNPELIDTAVVDPALMDPAGLDSLEALAAGMSQTAGATSMRGYLPPLIAGAQAGAVLTGQSAGSPQDQLKQLQNDLARLSQHATRRSHVASEVESLVATNSRVGSGLETLLGAVAGGPAADQESIPALQRLNAAVLAVGATTAALTPGSVIPVLVGSSDPGIAAATGGAVPLAFAAAMPSRVAAMNVEQIAQPAVFLSEVLPDGPLPAPLPLSLSDGNTAPRQVIVPARTEPEELAAIIAGALPGVQATLEPEDGGVRLRLQAGSLEANAPNLGAAIAGTAVPAMHTQVRLAEGSVLTSPTATIGGIWPGVEVHVKAVSAQPVRLTMTPDPSAGLAKMQAFLAAANAALGMTGNSPVAGAVGEALLGAVVGADGRPLVPGLSRTHDGRLALDREAFVRAYLRNAPGVEEAMGKVAAASGDVVEKTSDPRTGILPVRIQGELELHRDYSIGDAGIDERLAYEQGQLTLKAEALRSLLVRLNDEEEFLSHSLAAR